MVGSKWPTTAVRIARYASDELPDHLIYRIGQIRVASGTESKAVFDLKQYVASAISDRTDIVYLESGLCADLFNLIAFHAPLKRKGGTRNYAGTKPR
jgi:hypothetical protein